jgi:hypothetical protein
MKETTKTFIDGLCVGSAFMYLAVTIADLHGWLMVFGGIAAIGLAYAIFIVALAADEERRWRRENYEKGTHDYYGNEIENEDK